MIYFSVIAGQFTSFIIVGIMSKSNTTSLDNVSYVQ